MTSVKTKMLGVGALFTALGSVLTALFDGNPETNPDWPTLLATSSAAFAGFGLMFARENKVTSEQVKAAIDPLTTATKNTGSTIFKVFSAVLLASLFSGCAKFSGYTEKYSETGVLEAKTHFRGFTIMDGKAKLASGRASLTEKSGSVGVQESDMESTGKSIVEAIEKLPAAIRSATVP